MLFTSRVNPRPFPARFSEDKRKDMKWLTLERIKQQCRIEQDFTEEDSLLEMYGESAEEVLLNHLRRSYEDIMEVYGRIPAPLVLASLMLVDTSYTHRSPVSPQNMSIVPYAFDILVKPYMRLADYNDNENNNNRYGCKNL
jgi:uncharacterized phage protein (predicted DNA packaging)